MQGSLGLSQQTSGDQSQGSGLSQSGLGLTQQGSDLTEQGVNLAQTGYLRLAHQADMPYSGTDLSQTDLGLSQAETGTDLSQSGLGMTQLGTDLSQSELGQPQAGSTESLGLHSSLPQSTSRPMTEGLPDDWDWEFYLQLNPDVATAVGSDPDSARLHWQQWGHGEKRTYKVGVPIFCIAGAMPTSWGDAQLLPCIGSAHLLTLCLFVVAFSILRCWPAAAFYL